jgi:SAM-dependent methyltransferase
MKILREKTPEFWEQAWQEAHKYSLHARKRRELDQLDYWNSMAKFFANTAKKKAGKKRPQKVLSWLEQEGAWKPGSNVLDIGAGAGNFTIPMAKKAAHITALEPAPAMLSVLQKNVRDEGLSNVQYLDQEWEIVDPQQMGLTASFDLVFASLTPGIRDVETLEKMCHCSRDWCFLCDFAGYRWFPGHEELWRLIFQEKMPLPGHDIIYPFNYLYWSGYMPTLKVWIDVRDREMSVEEATASFEEYFFSYTDLTPEIKKTISNYVQEHAVSGVYQEIYRIRLGMILWQVNAGGQQGAVS